MVRMALISSVPGWLVIFHAVPNTGKYKSDYDMFCIGARVKLDKNCNIIVMHHQELLHANYQKIHATALLLVHNTTSCKGGPIKLSTVSLREWSFK